DADAGVGDGHGAELALLGRVEHEHGAAARREHVRGQQAHQDGVLVVLARHDDPDVDARLAHDARQDGLEAAREPTVADGGLLAQRQDLVPPVGGAGVGHGEGGGDGVHTAVLSSGGAVSEGSSGPAGATLPLRAPSTLRSATQTSTTATPVTCTPEALSPNRMAPQASASTGCRSMMTAVSSAGSSRSARLRNSQPPTCATSASTSSQACALGGAAWKAAAPGAPASRPAASAPPSDTCSRKPIS